jgi:Glycine transporter
MKQIRLLPRGPDHYKNFTIVGVMLMGLGGGITRDVLVNEVPGALTNPAYITVGVIAGFIGYRLAFSTDQLFREGLGAQPEKDQLVWRAQPAL